EPVGERLLDGGLRGGGRREEAGFGLAGDEWQPVGGGGGPAQRLGGLLRQLVGHVGFLARAPGGRRGGCRAGGYGTPHRSRVATPTRGRIMAPGCRSESRLPRRAPMFRGRWLGVLVVVAAAGSTAAADDPKPFMDAKSFDKLVVDTLRDVHDRGA